MCLECPRGTDGNVMSWMKTGRVPSQSLLSASGGGFPQGQKRVGKLISLPENSVSASVKWEGPLPPPAPAETEDGQA